MVPGEVVVELVVAAVPEAAMKTMAALLDDPTPIHYDVEAVRALGLGERPINQGPTNVGYLAELAARAAGGPESVRALSVRLHDSVFAGERLVCTATLRAVEPRTRRLELDLEAMASGRVVMSGTATVDPS
jgi:acyl dehydratase